MGIKHSVPKVSGDRGFATEWNADHVIDGNVDFAHRQPLNLRIENRTDWPAGPYTGQIIYRSDLNQLYVWNGSAWVLLTAAALAPKVPVTFVVAAYNSQDTGRADYVCDGTDDQVTIQSAISALPASGGSIYLLEGTYNITSPINTSGATVFSGSGFGTLLVATSDFIGAVLSVASQTLVQNLRINCNNKPFVRGIDALGSYSTIFNVSVWYSPVYGIYLGISCQAIFCRTAYNAGLGGIVLANNYAKAISNTSNSDYTNGITISTYNYTVACFNTIINCGLHGIHVLTGPGLPAIRNRILFNTVNGTGGDGIRINAEADLTEVTGNVLLNIAGGFQEINNLGTNTIGLRLDSSGDLWISGVLHQSSPP